MRNIISISLLIFIFFDPVWAGSAIFDYDDFGPQVLAHETIGYQWYQWNDVGDCDPGKTDDIKVVVYWDESIGTIKEKYPVDPESEKDYRYLTFVSALKYLDSTIYEYKDARNLIKTREKLLKQRK